MNPDPKPPATGLATSYNCLATSRASLPAWPAVVTTPAVPFAIFLVKDSVFLGSLSQSVMRENSFPSPPKDLFKALPNCSSKPAVIRTIPFLTARCVPCKLWFIFFEASDTPGAIPAIWRASTKSLPVYSPGFLASLPVRCLWARSKYSSILGLKAFNWFKRSVVNLSWSKVLATEEMKRPISSSFIPPASCKLSMSLVNWRVFFLLPAVETPAPVA